MRAASISILIGVPLLAGCTLSPASESPTPSSSAVNLDVEACDQFGDVLTLIYNQSIALREGRAGRQEMDGALRLAARILSRIEAEPGSRVSDALTELKRAAPAMASGAMLEPFDPDGEAWTDADTAMSAACIAAGSQLAVSAWTGG